MMVIRKDKPRVEGDIASRGLSKNSIPTYYSTDDSYKRTDPFGRFLETLSLNTRSKDDGRLWVSDTVFIQEYECENMYPTIKEGAVIWVDTAQVPIINRGIIEGALYLMKINITAIAVYDLINRVQVYSRNGTWGLLYWTDWAEARGEERKFIPLPTKEDHIKENSRYIGRVVGVVNPL